MLAVVAAVGLLGESLAGGFEYWTGTELAGLQGHEDTVSTAETEDVGFTHRSGSGVDVGED